MIKRTKNGLTAAFAALALTAGITATTYASSDSDSYKGPSDGSVKAESFDDASALSIEEIVSRLRTAGYTDIEEVERERDRYEVKGRSDDGQRFELYVDAQTGDVLKEERDD